MSFHFNFVFNFSKAMWHAIYHFCSRDPPTPSKRSYVQLGEHCPEVAQKYYDCFHGANLNLVVGHAVILIQFKLKFFLCFILVCDVVVQLWGSRLSNGAKKTSQIKKPTFFLVQCGFRSGRRVKGINFTKAFFWGFGEALRTLFWSFFWWLNAKKKVVCIFFGLRKKNNSLFGTRLLRNLQRLGARHVKVKAKKRSVPRTHHSLFSITRIFSWKRIHVS